MRVAWRSGEGSWETGGLWSTGAVPTGADDAVIAAPDAYTVTIGANEAVASVTLDSPDATLRVGASYNPIALDVAGAVALNAGTLLLFSGNVLVGATIDGAGGFLWGDAGALDDVTLAGVNQFVGGQTNQLSAYGSLVNVGTLNVGTGLQMNAAALTNAGLIMVGPGSAGTADGLPFLGVGAFPSGGPAVDNSGTIIVQAGASGYFGSFYGGGGAYFTNEGLLSASGLLTIYDSALINAGTIAIAAGAHGTIAATGAGGTFDNTGLLTVGAGAILDLAPAGLFTATSLGVIDNAGGTVVLTGGTYDNSGQTLDFANPGLPAGASLNGATILGGTVLVAPGSTLSAGTFSGATLTGPVRVGGPVAAVTLENATTILAAPGAMQARIEAGGGLPLRLASETLSNTVVDLGGNLSAGGPVTLDPGSVLDFATPGDFVSGYALTTTDPAPTLVLQGLGYITSAATIFSYPVLENDGTIVIGSGGNLSLGGAIGSGTILIAGGVLASTGAIAAGETIDFAGPGGSLYFGNYGRLATQTGATIAGFAAGDTIDLSTVSGDTDSYSDGTLSVTHAGTLVAALHFAGSYAAGDFHLLLGGTEITTSAAATTPANSVTITPATPTVGIGSVPALTGAVIADSNVRDIDSLTVTTPAGVATLSNTGPTGVVAGSAFGMAGTAADLTAALQGLVLTATSASLPVTTAPVSITVTQPDGAAAAATPTATLLRQYGTMATLDPTTIALSTSPDGTAFAPAQVERVNEAYAEPATGGAVFLPPGYAAAYLGGAAGASLVDPGTGNAVLGDGAGNDLIYAQGDNDTIEGGSGRDTLAASRGATIQSAAFTGNTLIFGGSGATSIAGPGGMAHATIVAGSGDTSILSAAAADLVALGAGSDIVYAFGVDTIIAGSGAATIGTGPQYSADGGAVVLGAGGALVSLGRTAETVYGGSGAATVGMGELETMYGGAGPSLVFASGGFTETFVGTTGATTIFGSGNFSGGSDGNNLIDITGGVINNAFGRSNGDVLVASAPGNPYGPTVTNLVAGGGNETLIATAGSGAAALYAGSGADLISAQGSSDTVYGGLGAATVFAGAGSASFVFDAHSGGGASTVFGFDATRDIIRLTGYAAGAGAAAIASASVANGNETLTLVDGTRITLVGVTGLSATNLTG